MYEIQTIEEVKIEEAKKNSKKGFTLVELVVVIAILAILAAIAIPVVSSIINTSSKNTALTNAQTIEYAIKEAQADITARNTETYKDAGDATTATNITVATVATQKGIASAFVAKSYNNVDYYPMWSADIGKVVVVAPTDTTKDINGATVSSLTALTDTDGAPDASILVTNLKSPAAA